MGAGWGDGAPVRHRHDEYAAREHGHLATDISGGPDDGTGDYVAHDELEDRLRDLNREIDDNFAKDPHIHDEIGELGSVVDDLADELRKEVDELKRDRDAMIRRMRLLEEALSLTPPAEFLTSRDEPPL